MTHTIRQLNRLLGAITLTLIAAPFIALAVISSPFNFIDFLYAGEWSRALSSIITSPFRALIIAILGVAVPITKGLQIGLISLISSFPMRIMHFFSKQLFFGSNGTESVNDMFVMDAAPSGLIDFGVSPHFFGKLTAKLLSLCCTMEFYEAYYAKEESPHNPVSVYFTEKNLNILKEQYATIEHERSAQTSMTIKSYLNEKLNETNLKVAQVRRLPSSDDTKAGKLQSAADELDAIQSAQRCFDYFTINKIVGASLSPRFKCVPITVLHYTWLAIEFECPKADDRQLLKEKLIWVMFQIQRGFNLVNGDNSGGDIPECSDGAIGLLVRVICDEAEKMPNSRYEAADVTPTNLSLALKWALDSPFINSENASQIKERTDYSNDPQAYKEKKKTAILTVWENNFEPLIYSNILTHSSLREIIEAGVDSWEPPEPASLQQNNTRPSVH